MHRSVTRRPCCGKSSSGSGIRTQLVEIKGISKRKKKPVVLTLQQYYLILGLIPPTLPHDGDGGAVHRPSGRRGAGARMGGHRFR